VTRPFRDRSQAIGATVRSALMLDRHSDALGKSTCPEETRIGAGP
jgi:hypothetical protein